MKQIEIKKILNTVIETVECFKEYQFIVAGAPNIELSYYTSIIKNKKIKVIENKTYELLSVSYAAIVTSGTATLETALFKVPQVVCYKSSYFSFVIAKLIVNIKYISLVNLIMDQEIVKELIQHDCNKNKITKATLLLVPKFPKIEVKSSYLTFNDFLWFKSRIFLSSLVILSLLQSC